MRTRSHTRRAQHKLPSVYVTTKNDAKYKRANASSSLFSPGAWKGQPTRVAHKLSLQTNKSLSTPLLSSKPLDKKKRTVSACPCCRIFTKSSSAKADDASSNARSIRRVASTYTRIFESAVSSEPEPAAVAPHKTTGTVALAGTTGPRREREMVG